MVRIVAKVATRGWHCGITSPRNSGRRHLRRDPGDVAAGILHAVKALAVDAVLGVDNETGTGRLFGPLSTGTPAGQ